jgi:methylmalonyl-CoA mutase C-terminal domain/subunit
MKYIEEYGGNLDEILILVGGIIPTDDIERLKEMGVDEVFIPGTPVREIVEYIKKNVKRKSEVKRDA